MDEGERHYDGLVEAPDNDLMSEGDSSDDDDVRDDDDDDMSTISVEEDDDDDIYGHLPIDPRV